jgi:hypothetical protein
MAGRPGGTQGIPTEYEQSRIDLSLFNLEEDMGETTDLSQQHPEIVRKMQGLADAMRQDLGDSLTQVIGKGNREPGRL